MYGAPPGTVIVEERIDPAELHRRTALINIRPSQGNPSMEIEDGRTRRQVREIALALIGSGEALP